MHGETIKLLAIEIICLKKNKKGGTHRQNVQTSS